MKRNVYYFTVNETLALEKQIGYLLTKGWRNSDVPFEQINNDDHIKAIIDRNIPFVMFDKISKLSKCSKIIIDDKSGFQCRSAFNW
jgi:LacI family transcriptional regulator